MDKLDALELAIQDAAYMGYQTKDDKYMDQADALKLLLDEIKGA
jgi:hypothetical protein